MKHHGSISIAWEAEDPAGVWTLSATIAILDDEQQMTSVVLCDCWHVLSELSQLFDTSVADAFTAVGERLA